ncbi:MAG TPA: hypothetical protein VHJ19_02110 [Gammaproteobacteria bacterium]|jgi:hypothetical protein|nr:hypothetical protein [Gammaproteobacteria bacterium]
MFKELAQHVAAKHKATEVKGEEGGPVKTEMTVRERLHSIMQIVRFTWFAA